LNATQRKEREAKDADSDATGIRCKKHQMQGLLKEDVCFYPRKHSDEFPPKKCGKIRFYGL
jgi:hypothetical protein